MASSIGRALAVDRRRADAGRRASRPRTSSPACSSSSRPLLLSGIVLLAGARHLPREMALMLAKLKAAPAARRRDAGPPLALSRPIARRPTRRVAHPLRPAIRGIARP